MILILKRLVIITLTKRLLFVIIQQEELDNKIEVREVVKFFLIKKLKFQLLLLIYYLFIY